MFKKILSLALVALMLASVCAGFASCGDDGIKYVDDGVFRLGVILLHDEKSTYDLNFLNGVYAAKEALGLADDQVIIKKNIPETNECYEAAADLIADGCDLIFADSFGHETFVLKAAKACPEVQFCHATGTMAHTEKLDNFHDAFASIYEGRYIAGVAAGLKLKAMMEADSTIVPKIGYVGAFTYAEVISGYTSFYLGVKSIVENVTMDVQFTGSWYDEVEEKNAAQALINNGCVLISQHADSLGAPTACEDKKVPNVSYNGSTEATCPETFIISSRIDWAPYFKYICQQVMDKKTIDTDWTGTFSTDSVKLTELGKKAPVEGTQEKLDEVKAKLMSGELKVFDVSKFTVTVVTEGENTKNVNAKVDENGHLTSYMADVDTDPAYTADTEVIKDGYFHESEYRSAPYFDVQIDGINLLNAKF